MPQRNQGGASAETAEAEDIRGGICTRPLLAESGTIRGGICTGPLLAEASTIRENQCVDYRAQTRNTEA